jgi:hypothetical protein
MKRLSRYAGFGMAIGATHFGMIGFFPIFVSGFHLMTLVAETRLRGGDQQAVIGEQEHDKTDAEKRKVFRSFKVFDYLFYQAF